MSAFSLLEHVTAEHCDYVSRVESAEPPETAALSEAVGRIGYAVETG